MASLFPNQILGNILEKALQGREILTHRAIEPAFVCEIGDRVELSVPSSWKAHAYS
jgi:hypothetical protein